MSLADGDNPRPNRDDMLDLSYKVGYFVDEHNARQAMFDAWGTPLPPKPVKKKPFDWTQAAFYKPKENIKKAQKKV